MVLSIHKRYAVNITRIALMGIVTGVNLWLTSMSYLFWEETQKIRAENEFSSHFVATNNRYSTEDAAYLNPMLPIDEDIRTTQAIFNRQKKDKSWEANAKKIIEDAIADPELSGSKLLNTECKTTLCRAVFKHRNFEDSHQLQMLLPLNLADQFPRAIIYPPNPDQAILESIVYFVRSGYTPLE